MIKLLRKHALAVVLAGGIFVSPGLAYASAILGPGGQVFATGGNVVVDILPSSSAFNNLIHYYPAFPSTLGRFLIGTDSSGLTVDLGLAGFSFTAGTELVFGIDSPSPSPGGSTFFMGPAARNPDNIIHANVSSGIIGPGFIEAWDVGFEDISGGGDLDFNDAIIRVSQTRPVPEPTTLALLGLGLAGIGFARKRLH